MKKVFIPLVMVFALVACAKTKDGAAKAINGSASLTDVNKYKLIASFLKSQSLMTNVHLKLL